MECQEAGCTNEIDMQTIKRLQIGCSGCGCGRTSANAHPCTVCGRLHWSNGLPAFTQGGDKSYLKGNEVVYRH